MANMFKMFVLFSKIALKCFIKFNFAAIFSFNEIVNMKISFRNRFAVSVQT